MYSIDVLIALEEDETLSQDWWAARYAWGDLRAGGMPPELADPGAVSLALEVDPDTEEEFVRVTFPLPPGTGLGRATELSHMLSSCMSAEGFTLRKDGIREETLPGEHVGEPTATVGELSYTEGGVCSDRCLTCALSTETKFGCCTEGCAFSLADIGASLLAGEDEFIAKVLALPGEVDYPKWHPYLSGGRCVFHDPSCGCTLERTRMPLQCRTYLCMPHKLLPPDVLADYNGYVDALEEAEAFIEEHMRIESGVDFDSPLEAIKAAAEKAFAAWTASQA